MSVNIGPGHVFISSSYRYLSFYFTSLFYLEKIICAWKIIELKQLENNWNIFVSGK